MGRKGENWMWGCWQPENRSNIFATSISVKRGLRFLWPKWNWQMCGKNHRTSRYCISLLCSTCIRAANFKTMSWMMNIQSVHVMSKKSLQMTWARDEETQRCRKTLAWYSCGMCEGVTEFKHLKADQN